MANFLKSVFTSAFSSFQTSLRSSILSQCKPSVVREFNPSLEFQRTKYTDWRMLRDAKRRKCVKEYAKLRAQVNSIRMNTILPKKIRDIAYSEITSFPTNSCHTQLHERCILTSRARGRYRKFRMSRIAWRNLADYNLISGAERAMW